MTASVEREAGASELGSPHSRIAGGLRRTARGMGDDPEYTGSTSGRLHGRAGTIDPGIIPRAASMDLTDVRSAGSYLAHPTPGV
ncbi:hypothetical protein TRAPUB_8787 [Trametes pubescens]|uniref:Uncharacterized protein n=1 Tax=Trametes pubescens TaxID=154538 RepID=A0A1M2W465_TRAPU|nr:hypothetical protein TRAPUB_8787 [Trametes pubescens]